MSVGTSCEGTNLAPVAPLSDQGSEEEAHTVTMGELSRVCIVIRNAEQYSRGKIRYRALALAPEHQIQRMMQCRKEYIPDKDGKTVRRFNLAAAVKRKKLKKDMTPFLVHLVVCQQYCEW